MTPELSVVIPTYNRREYLRACLESLARQTASPEEFEVVVAVDGSQDGTSEMLASLSVPYTLRVLTQPQSGQCAALNLGVREAAGRYLLFLDDDMIASPELVSAHLRTQRERGPVGAIGFLRQLIPPRSDRFARARAEEWHAHYEGLARREPSFRDAYSGNLSVPRTAFDEVGGFVSDHFMNDTELDTEFAFRLHQRGLRFVFVPNAVATEDNRADWKTIVRDSERRGRVSLELYRRHPSILPWLELGGFSEPSRKWLALRALLLILRAPPLLLAAVGRLLPGGRTVRTWYRFVYSYSYWLGMQRATDRDTWRRLRRGVLVLTYHAIAGHGERSSRFVIPARRFAREMAWLRRRGYQVIGLDEFLRSRSEFRLPPPKSVVVTFDDGYADNRLAAPILGKLGFPATIFLVTRAGERNGWDSDGAELAGRSLMRIQEARAMLGDVIAFGAHTRTHADLGSLSREELESEVEGSRRDLEAALGVPVTTFAYPYGKSTPDVQDVVRTAGFIGACSTVLGRNRPSADSYALRRVEVRGSDSLIRFALTLWLGDTRSRARWFR